MGALFIGLISYYTLEIDHSIALIAFAGCIGSLTDSILGRFLQGKFYCTKSNVVVEERFQYDVENTLISGFKWIDNNLVNFTANLTGSFVIILINLLYG